MYLLFCRASVRRDVRVPLLSDRALLNLPDLTGACFRVLLVPCSFLVFLFASVHSKFSTLLLSVAYISINMFTILILLIIVI